MHRLEHAVRDGDWMALATAFGLDVEQIVRAIGSAGRSKLLSMTSTPVGIHATRLGHSHEFVIQTGADTSTQLRIMAPRLQRTAQNATWRILPLPYDGTACVAEEECRISAHRENCYEYDDEGISEYNSCSLCHVDHTCGQCETGGILGCQTHGCLHPISYF